MNLHTMKLVTVICEALLEERVVEILRACGAHGHTAFSVRGSGSQGDRSADILETGNVQVEIIVKPTVAETVLERLHRELFNDYAIVAYEADVRVMRPNKF
jgi:nitrogen regulatory protein P-II 2